MKPVNTIELHFLIDKFINDRDWDQFHSIKNLSMALSVEASELAEIFQWQTEEQSNNSKAKPEITQKLQDELADILFYLLRIAHKAEIDLEFAVKNKLLKNEKKYPVTLSKGNSKKYSEF